MTPEFTARLDARLTVYREFAKHAKFTACRLVHYAAIDCQAIDVPLDGIEAEITGCLAEGFHIDWALHGDRCYLRVYEAPVPDWEYVFEERGIPVYDENGNEIDWNSFHES